MMFEEALDFLTKVPPFQFLDDAAMKDITRDLSMEYYPKGTTILYQGGPVSEYLYVIKKGGVKVSIGATEDEEVLVDYRGEGDLIGYLSLFSEEKARANVVTVDDTICYLVKRSTIRQLIDTNPTVRNFFHKSFFNKYLDRTMKDAKNKSAIYGHSDKALFTMPVGELSAKEVVTGSQDITIHDAAKLMSQRRISCLVLTDNDSYPVGIITDRDLRDKVVAKARDVSEPVRGIMSLPLIRTDAREYCFEAILKMIKYNIHHLLVIRDGVLTGILTNHDLMMLQGTSPLSLVKDIESQQTLEGLVPISKRVNSIIGMLLGEGAKASNILRIITEINDRLVRKILEAAERQLGPPPLPYCWIVFGSEGRKEQTFKTDQDNALIYADPETKEQADAAENYFAKFTVLMRDSLLQAGFPLCPAGFMASNPRWHQPLKVWKKYFNSWITTPTAEAVLNSVVFFDFRYLYGDQNIAEALRDSIISMAKDQKIFLGYIANLAIKNRPPVGFLKTFVVEKSGEHKDKLNLKIKGIAPIVDMARLFALEKGIRETSTIERIDVLRDIHSIAREYADELIHAFEFIMLLRIQHQFDMLKEERGVDNFINPNSLSNLDKRTLKEAFGVITRIQEMIIERYKAMIW